MIDNDIHRIINQITYILTNEDHESLDAVGNKLIGLIGALDNIAIIYDHYPMLEVIANRGTELKFTTDESRAKQVLGEIEINLADLRKSVSVNG